MTGRRRGQAPPRKPRCFVRNKGRREYVASDVVNSLKSEHIVNISHLTCEHSSLRRMMHRMRCTGSTRMGGIKKGEGDINYAPAVSAE